MTDGQKTPTHPEQQTIRRQLPAFRARSRGHFYQLPRHRVRQNERQGLLCSRKLRGLHRQKLAFRRSCRSEPRQAVYFRILDNTLLDSLIIFVTGSREINHSPLHRLRLHGFHFFIGIETKTSKLGLIKLYVVECPIVNSHALINSRTIIQLNCFAISKPRVSNTRLDKHASSAEVVSGVPLFLGIQARML